MKNIWKNNFGNTAITYMGKTAVWRICACALIKKNITGCIVFMLLMSNKKYKVTINFRDITTVTVLATEITM